MLQIPEITIKDLLDNQYMKQIKEGARVVHFFNKNNPKAGGVTIMYKPILKHSNGRTAGMFAEVAFSYCKAGDTYSRKCGRNIAAMRMDSGESVVLPIYIDGAPVLYLRSMFDGIYKV